MTVPAPRDPAAIERDLLRYWKVREEALGRYQGDVLFLACARIDQLLDEILRGRCDRARGDGDPIPA